MQKPRVAIIGAGPAGCMLARLLHLANIEAAIFEGEGSPNYRSQGGTLDLHEADGLAALKDAGLYDEFLRHARWDGESLAITDKDLKVYLRLSATTGDNQGQGKLGGQRPEIDRAELRRILMEALPEGMVRWGHHLKSVRPDGVLVFADGTTASGYDLVVGADGAWSKVRAVLSDQQPIFTGIAHHEMSIADAEHTFPEVYRVVNRGSVFAHADGRKLSLQQLGDGSIGIYINTLASDENWMQTSTINMHDFESIRTFYLGGAEGAFAEFHPTLREAIANSGPKCTPRSLYQLPVGFRWQHRRGFTLIGDSAHLMTPFAGEGVNVALQDARMLARYIRAAVSGLSDSKPENDDEKSLKDALDGAVVAYEKEMWPRAQRVAQLTDEVKQAWFFTADVPRSVMARTTASHLRFHTPRLLHPLATAAAYAYFFVKRV